MDCEHDHYKITIYGSPEFGTNATLNCTDCEQFTQTDNVISLLEVLLRRLKEQE